MNPIIEFILYFLSESIFFLVSLIYSAVVLLLISLKLLKNGFGIFRSKQHEMPEELKKWTHGFIITDLRLHYVECGDKNKPLLLCVHGFPDFWYGWRHQLKAFENDYHIVAVDLRGYGDSEKPDDIDELDVKNLIKDICDFIPALGHKKAYLIGHGFGGFICWLFAHIQPDFVEKLIILNAPHPESYLLHIKTNLKQFLKSWYIFIFHSQNIGEIFYGCNDYDELLSLFTRKGLGFVNREMFTEGDLKAYKYEVSKNNNLSSMINIFRAMKRRLSFGSLNVDSLIESDVLIIYGEQDGFYNIEPIKDSARFCKKSELKIISNSSHWVHQDTPDIVNNYIKDFIAT